MRVSSVARSSVLVPAKPAGFPVASANVSRKSACNRWDAARTMVAFASRNPNFLR